MARSDPAVELRVPSEGRRTPPPPDDERPRLRLVVTRGRLGAELEGAFALPPVAITALELTFPDVAFPVELTGGIAAFRHRRGQLERVALAIEAGDFSRWARPRIERVLGAPLLHHLVVPLEDGFMVGVATETMACAFDVVCAPLEGDLRLIPVEARGLGMAEPPHRTALRLVEGLFKPLGEVTGGVLVLRQAARVLSRALFPLAGMRVPSSLGLVLEEMGFEVGGVTLGAAREVAPRLLGERAVRAVEASVLAAEADGALRAGSLDDARRGYLEALGRAPRHPEIARRLAELDRAIGGRDEAALGTLSDAMAPIEAGALGGALLLAHGDVEGARVAFRRAGESEPYGGLAARCLALQARHEDDPLGVLDRAIARAPMLADLRWARFEARIAAGRAAEAREDAEHLEAAATGASARHDVLRRAGDRLLASRHLEEATRAYERALRYAPDGVEALAGLARAMALVGKRGRALELSSRAVGLAEKRGLRDDGSRLELAAALAEIADDRPAAIAHVRAIEASSPWVFDARAREARWCAEIGDLAGAGAALARLAEAVEANRGALLGERAEAFSHPRYGSRIEASAAIGAHLLEGARIHELDRRDLAAAHRLLALALRLVPRHHGVREAFRRVARALELGPVSESDAPTEIPPAGATTSDAPTEIPARLPERGARTTDVPMPLGQPPLEGDEDEVEVSAEDELDAERLADRLRADPNDDQTAEELADLLERLGRDHELLALVAGRIDDFGPSEARIARRRKVLSRLEERARREGRHDEAELYAMMRNAPS